ncbi:MAG: alpha/beta hydrolase family protein [Sphingomonadaceae bacterium]
MLTAQQRFELDSLTITRLTLGDGNSLPVSYYLSLPAQRAPLVLYIQGSGCTPPFVGLGTAQRYSTIFSWLPLAAQKRYAVMVVDKPYQSDQQQQGQPGSAIGCAGEFNQHFSYGAWLATVKRALRHALTRPEVDASRVLVLGISEGAPVAAGLARDMPEVSDVVLFGANGPSQLYDFAANIHLSGATDEEKLRQLQELDRNVNAIAADPASSSKFVWGHTYLRWSSFFAQSTLENLARSSARVYLASGMRDHNVPILSTEVLYAQLRAQGRDVTFRRIPLAGHNLAPEGRTIVESQPEYDAAMAWFARQ